MKTTTFLAIAASVSGAVATFKQAPKFDCPRSFDNKCDDKQKNGFDWADLNPGDFSEYNNFNWRNFKCEDQPNKRSPHLSPRTGRKAVTGRCGPTKEVSPSFGCDQSKGVDKFSILQIDISVEFDTDLEFHYDMPDGKQCKHRSRCSKGGSTVPNTQCGGAKNVTIVYPPPPNPPKPDCGIAVHEIKFDCNPPEAPQPPKYPPPPPPPKETTTSKASNIPPTQYPYPESSKTSSKSKDSPNNPKPTYAPEPPKQPEPPVKLPELPCPPVVPSCLNTWIFSVACLDNTDYNCYCPDVAFVENIFTCIYAYGETDIIISQAILFFQGICAPHAPQNPAIVTGAETITKVITVTAQPTVSAVYTTVIVSATQTVPCSTDGTAIEGSSTTTIYAQTVQVPEVAFQTADSGEVGVVATAPQAVLAGPTSADSSAPTTLATQPAVGTGASSPAAPSKGPPKPVVVAGAGKVGGSSVGLGLAILAAVAAL